MNRASALFNSSGLSVWSIPEDLREKVFQIFVSQWQISVCSSFTGLAPEMWAFRSFLSLQRFQAILRLWHKPCVSLGSRGNTSRKGMGVSCQALFPSLPFLLLPSFLPCSGVDFLLPCNASELKEVVATIHGLPPNEAYIWGQRLYYRQRRGFGFWVVWGGKALESFGNMREVIWLVLCEDSSSCFPKWWQKGSEGRRKCYN